MSRYFVRPKSYKPLQVEDDWYHDPMIPSITTCDHEPVDTGLLDSNGDPIMRAPRPVGFGRDGDW